MHADIRVEVVSHVDEGTNLRRFGWVLYSTNDHPLPSSSTYATKREATKEAQIALERAKKRGRLR